MTFRLKLAIVMTLVTSSFVVQAPSAHALCPPNLYFRVANTNQQLGGKARINYSNNRPLACSSGWWSEVALELIPPMQEYVVISTWAHTAIGGVVEDFYTEYRVNGLQVDEDDWGDLDSYSPSFGFSSRTSAGRAK